MSSLLTNTSAMTALSALSMTQTSLAKTEKQISTGLAISTAADNASYWSIATKMNSNVGALGAVSSALSESSAMVGTMSAALTSTISVINTIKNDLVTASQPGADAAKIQTDISAQQQLLRSIGTSSNFNGQNWLATSGGSINLVASYDSDAGVSFITVDTANTALFAKPATASDPISDTGSGYLDKAGTATGSKSIMNLDVSSFGVTDFANALKDVETALQGITSAASTLGATTTNITTQQSYISNLSDSLTTGVGSLVDADMNEASTRLSALQVQQQLGIQSLSIANTNTQMIMRLFQGG